MVRTAPLLIRQIGRGRSCLAVLDHRLEIAASIGDQCSVARMVDGLHRRNDVNQLRIMVVDVFHEFGLGIRWASDENGTRVSYRLGNSMKKILILSRVPATDGIRFVVDMPGRVIGVHYQVIESRQSKMEHASLMVIDPHDSVIVIGHRSLPSRIGVVPSGAPQRFHCLRSNGLRVKRRR
jgi:hypothetical protein